MPNGGDIIYGVAHQHSGGIGAALYGEDGRVTCSSTPAYGKGNESGNESGYIVGMSTCCPQPGSVKIFDGETLTMKSNYSSAEMHTGAMGLFYVLTADPSPGTESFLHAAVNGHEKMGIAISIWGLLLFGVTIALAAAAAIVSYLQKPTQGVGGYHSILI